MEGGDKEHAFQHILSFVCPAVFWQPARLKIAALRFKYGSDVAPSVTSCTQDGARCPKMAPGWLEYDRKIALPALDGSLGVKMLTK